MPLACCLPHNPFADALSRGMGVSLTSLPPLPCKFTPRLEIRETVRSTIRTPFALTPAPSLPGLQTLCVIGPVLLEYLPERYRMHAFSASRVAFVDRAPLGLKWRFSRRYRRPKWEGGRLVLTSVVDWARLIWGRLDAYLNSLDSLVENDIIRPAQPFVQPICSLQTPVHWRQLLRPSQKFLSIRIFFFLVYCYRDATSWWFEQGLVVCTQITRLASSGHGGPT